MTHQVLEDGLHERVRRMPHKELLDALRDDIDQQRVGSVTYRVLYQEVLRRMRSPQDMVREFHQAVGAPIRQRHHVVVDRHSLARAGFLREEVQEYDDAVMSGEGVAAVAKELADVVYVAYGGALEHGIDLDQAVAEVHRSNMTKIQPDGTVLKEPATGKVIKPPTYEEADMAGALGLEAIQ